MKILLVDDNANMRSTIASFLHSDDNEIIELEDGEKAVEQYENIKPDWVLMDIKMGKLNGLDATKMIKQKFPDAHIAIVTNYSDNVYRICAEKVGADAFVSKQNLYQLKNIIGRQAASSKWKV